MKRSFATWLIVVIATLIPSLSRASVLLDPIYVGTLVSTGEPVYEGTLVSDGALTSPVQLILGTPTPGTTAYDPTTTPPTPGISPSAYGFVTQPTGPSSYSAYLIAPTDVAPLDNGLSIQLGSAVPAATYSVGAASASPQLYDPSLNGATLMGTQSAVPEPASLVLLGSGLVFAGTRLRRKKGPHAD
jgi:hypothetical protein